MRTDKKRLPIAFKKCQLGNLGLTRESEYRRTALSLTTAASSNARPTRQKQKTYFLPSSYLIILQTILQCLRHVVVLPRTMYTFLPHFRDEITVIVKD